MGLFDFFKKKTKQPQQSTVNVNINVSFSGIESHTTYIQKTNKSHYSFIFLETLIVCLKSMSNMDTTFALIVEI